MGSRFTPARTCPAPGWSPARRRTRLGAALPVAAAALAALGACRSGPARGPAAGAPRAAGGPPSVARCGEEGLLRVRNYTGRVVEVYAARPAKGQRPEFVGLASPGATEFSVPGPADLAVTYYVREPADGRDAAAVSWRRRAAAAAPPGRLALELACRPRA